MDSLLPNSSSAPQAASRLRLIGDVETSRTAVREDVWEAGAIDVSLDLCDPIRPAVQWVKSFTLGTRPGLSGAFLVRVREGQIPGPFDVVLSVAMNGTQRQASKHFQLRPVSAGGLGDIGVVEMQEADSGTWSATLAVSAPSTAQCTGGSLVHTIQVAAVQPWGGVSSAEFSWDERVSAVLLLVWAAVRLLAVDVAESPLSLSCDAYCCAYGLGIATKAAVEARVKWAFVTHLASAARLCALVGDGVLLLTLALRSWASRASAERPGASPPLPQIPEDEVAEISASTAPATDVWAQPAVWAAMGSASLLPALHPGAPPGFFMCADGEDPRLVPDGPASVLQLLPLAMALLAAVQTARQSANIGATELAAFGFASAPAAAWTLALLCASAVRRHLQLLLALGVLRTGSAVGLVVGDCIKRRPQRAWASPAVRLRMVSVGVLAALLVLLCKQMEAMAAAEPGPWVGRAAPLARGVAAANGGRPPGGSSGAGAAEAGTRAIAPFVPSAPAPASATAPAPEPEEALVCVADAAAPLRFRVQLGRLCGDKGWTQRFLFMGSLSEGPGMEAVCISSANSPSRFRLTQGSSCSDLEWKQVSVFYLHTERGAGRVALCVAEAQSPSRFRFVTAPHCGDMEWKERFVLYTVPSRSLRSHAMAANVQKVAGSDLDLLRASRAEADMLHGLLEEIPVEVLRTHSLWKASVMMRRTYYNLAYASQVDPGGAKEKSGLMHTWDAETLARRWLHCQGLLRDQTDVHDCAAAASSSAAQPVERTCAAAPGSTSQSTFLLPWNMREEGPQLCVARDKGGPLWGELRSDKCASTRRLAEELLDRTHDGDKRLNEAEGRLDGCPTCAVVGSSGNLLGQALGAEIDGHDVVMRINCAPTLGFSVDVGTKTTHRIFYPEASWFAAPQDEPCAQLADLGSEEASLLAVLFKPLDVEWWHHVVSGMPPPKDGFWHPVPVKMSVPGARVAVVSPSWLNHATAGLSALQKSQGAEPKKDGWPSSGLMGILLALQRCRSVNVYGFGHHFRNGSQLDASMNKYYM